MKWGSSTGGLVLGELGGISTSNGRGRKPLTPDIVAQHEISHWEHDRAS